MALQTFTAGQVLTAAQVTALQANDYNQTVSTKTDSYTLVAADKGTRVVMNKATATTITVNTSLFSAGDTLWIHNIGAGVCTITAGTATVSTSGSLALAQNAGGTLYFTSTGVAIFFPSAAGSAQGLTLLNTTSFSGVSSQVVSNVFSANYKSYKIIIECNQAGVSDIKLRLRTGATSAASAYDLQYMRGQGTTTTVAGLGSQTEYFLTTNQASGPSWCEVTLHKPFEATQTYFQTLWFSHVYSVGITGGFHQTATSYESFEIFPTTSNFTGSVKTYGLNQ
jgi:hypothetical protein